MVFSTWQLVSPLEQSEFQNILSFSSGDTALTDEVVMSPWKWTYIYDNWKWLLKITFLDTEIGCLRLACGFKSESPWCVCNRRRTKAEAKARPKFVFKDVGTHTHHGDKDLHPVLTQLPHQNIHPSSLEYESTCECLTITCRVKWESYKMYCLIHVAAIAAAAVMTSKEHNTAAAAAAAAAAMTSEGSGHRLGLDISMFSPHFTLPHLGQIWDEHRNFQPLHDHEECGKVGV